MERKLKHRLLSIIMLVCLVVILLPLFQGKGEIKTQTVAVQSAAPTLPLEETNEVNMQTISSPLAVVNPPEQTVPTSDLPMVTENTNISAESLSQVVVTQPTDDFNNKPVISQTETKAMVSEQTKVIQTEKKKAVTPEVKQVHKKVLPVARVKKKIEKKKKIAKLKPKHHIAKKTTIAKHEIKPLPTPKPNLLNPPLTENGLAQLHTVAWVVQVGSFKQKNNASAFATELRKKGYVTFMQKIDNDPGSVYRVYIGPEHQAKNAYLIAEKINQAQQVKSIVIRYRPLAKV